MGGGLDISMLLLRYAGMADLCTGAVQRRVTTIPGSAAGHPASRPTAAPGTAPSLDLPSPGLPAEHATCGAPSVPAAECSRRSRQIAARAGLGTSRWCTCDGLYRPAREGERARRIAGTRCPRGQLSVISASGLALRSANYLDGLPVPDPPGGDHQVSGS